MHLNFRVKNIYLNLRVEILFCFTINFMAMAWQRNYFLKHFNVNLFMSRHLEMNSLRLFSVNEGPALPVTSLSVKQRSHFLVPQTYYRVCEATLELILIFIFLSFRSQMHFNSSVLFSLLLFLKEAVWLLQRSLKSFSKVP